MACAIGSAWPWASLAAGYLVARTVLQPAAPDEAIVTRITSIRGPRFYRIQIWTFGIENIMGSPWIGIGLADWQRAALDGVVERRRVLARWSRCERGCRRWCCCIAAIVMLVRAVRQFVCAVWTTRPAAMALRLDTSLIASVLAALTVHLWNAMHAHFFFFIGLGGWLADAKRVKQVTSAKAVTPQVLQWQATPHGWPQPVR